MVAVIQTFGSSLKWNPHLHAIVSRGVWDRTERWLPIPYVDTHKAELLFRHKIVRLLRDRELVSQERSDLFLSWRHSGFSVHNRPTVYPSDSEEHHKLPSRRTIRLPRKPKHNVPPASELYRGASITHSPSEPSVLRGPRGNSQWSVSRSRDTTA
jgi:Putative transposase